MLHNHSKKIKGYDVHPDPLLNMETNSKSTTINHNQTNNIKSHNKLKQMGKIKELINQTKLKQCQKSQEHLNKNK